MVEDTVELLRSALKRPGFTKRQLARDAGIHPNTLLGCEDDGWNPQLSTLRAIEPFLPRQAEGASSHNPASQSGEKDGENFAQDHKEAA